jgi:hypothetical protein
MLKDLVTIPEEVEDHNHNLIILPGLLDLIDRNKS